VVFTYGATSAINLLAHSYGARLGPGDFPHTARQYSSPKAGQKSTQLLIDGDCRRLVYTGECSLGRARLVQAACQPGPRASLDGARKPEGDCSPIVWDGLSLTLHPGRRPFGVPPMCARHVLGDRRVARGDGRHARLLKAIARIEVLILDDWGLANLTPDQGRDLLEIVDDRHGRGSTIVTSQLPVEHWHEAIANPTVADAILDRLVHNAHRLTLKGDSLRKAAAKRAGLDDKKPS
jgi:hypothetical protein